MEDLGSSVEVGDLGSSVTETGNPGVRNPDTTVVVVETGDSERAVGTTGDSMGTFSKKVKELPIVYKCRLSEIVTQSTDILESSDCWKEVK